MSSSALQQIGAFQIEKTRRTPAQQKIASLLLDAAKMERGEALALGIQRLEVQVDHDERGRVLVELDAPPSTELLQKISNDEGTVVSAPDGYQVIRAWVLLRTLEPLASRPEVKSIRVATEGIPDTGSVVSEGDVAHQADLARATFGVSGAGVKVGVLSDSVDHLEASQASGDLGPVTVLPGQSGIPRTGEGTAMLEIIHDLAPGADLFFATASVGSATFAQNIRDLRFKYGCDVIVDDVGYPDDSPFQDGPLAQAVNDVTANGALYFASAGNSGHKSIEQSGTWEGDFLDGGELPSKIQTKGPSLVHSFGPFPFNAVVSGGTEYRVDLFWADPLGSSSNDYDLYLLDSTGSQVIGKSDSSQVGAQNPYESLSKLKVGQRIVVVRHSGEGRFLHLDVGRGRLAISTGGRTRGHGSAADAFSVAAFNVANSAFGPFTNLSKSTVESFSSDGPRRIFFSPAGTPITPGNFSSTGGQVRQKPDVAAADGVQTSFFSARSSTNVFRFFGTSAAAPHGAAVAALLKSYNYQLTSAKIRELLTSTALDIEAARVDQNSGAGVLMALEALRASPPPEPPTVTDFSPRVGTVGTSVSIFGTALSHVTRVAFGGLPASFTLVNDSLVSTVVPAGAKSSRIEVNALNGNAISNPKFFIAAFPEIHGFVPIGGRAGTNFLISGANLLGTTSVILNGFPAKWVVESSSNITVVVPEGASTGLIAILNSVGFGSSFAPFVVGAPAILEPLGKLEGGAGTGLVIQGANLDTTTRVEFGGAAAQILRKTASSIAVLVPDGATTGPVSITTPSGTVLSQKNFVVLRAPQITGVSPTTGPIGTTVTISGADLTPVTDVFFGGVRASNFAANLQGQILVRVPIVAVSGVVSLKTAVGDSVGVSTFAVVVPPPNDEYTDSVAIDGTSGTAVVPTTAGATKQIGEPNHAGNIGGKSVWFRWIAPADGVWEFDTAGSTYDTLLAVYSGSVLTNLTRVAFNDDSPGSPTNTSQVIFAAAKGTPYSIAVDGYNNDFGISSGKLSLNWTQKTDHPAVTTFSPSSGVVGAQIGIEGVNLGKIGKVLFNGVESVFEINSSFRITATVPAVAVSGPIVVVASEGTAASSAEFTPIPQLTIHGSSATQAELLEWDPIAGFFLEGAHVLGLWSPITTGVRVTSGRFSYPASTNLAGAYFRLRHP